MSKLIKEDIFEYLNYNIDVEGNANFAVPNEIFPDLMSEYKFSKCAFGYSYYYLSMYLHLYAKYGSEDNVDKFTAENIRRILGVTHTSQQYNPITKKNGLLDKLGYTSTRTDYPVSLLRLERVDGIMEVHHYMYSEEKRDLFGRFTSSPNFTVKHPDKMYWRTQEDRMDSYLSGTLNEADNTHMIPLEMFLHAFNNPEIMTKGFYVYGFIKYKNDKSKGRRKERKTVGWQIPLKLFVEDIGMSEGTLKKMLKALEKYGFISVIRSKSHDGTDLPNTYIANMNPEKVVNPQ